MTLPARFILLSCFSMTVCLYALTSTEAKKNKRLPLIQAAQEGDVEKTKSLLAAGAMVGVTDERNCTPLHHAIKQGNTQTALYLISKGAPLIALDKDENTPLSLARAQGMLDVEKALGLKFVEQRQHAMAEGKYFIFLVASFNNAHWYKKNIASIFNQTYPNYMVIYMDDCSTDGTFELAKHFVYENRQEARWIFIKNKTKKYCLGNYMYAIERFCTDNTILITLDGDDWLASPDVLSYLNKIYKSQVLLTYGNSRVYPTGERVPHCKAIKPSILKKNGLFRKHCKNTKWFWPIHHLRSFSSWLFRKINRKDLLDSNGRPFTFAEDVAYMLPMIEMAGPRYHRYIDKDLYTYNMENPLTTIKTRGDAAIQTKLKFICSKKPYALLPRSEMSFFT